MYGGVSEVSRAMTLALHDRPASESQSLWQGCVSSLASPEGPACDARVFTSTTGGGSACPYQLSPGPAFCSTQALTIPAINASPHATGVTTTMRRLARRREKKEERHGSGTCSTSLNMKADTESSLTCIKWAQARHCRTVSSLSLSLAFDDPHH